MTAPVRVVVLADTHLRRGRARRLPDAVYRALDAADGTVVSLSVVTV
jgi:hypothetical protein